MTDEPTQLDKFKAAARDAGLNENDEEGFTEIVRRVAALKHKKDAGSEGTE